MAAELPKTFGVEDELPKTFDVAEFPPKTLLCPKIFVEEAGAAAANGDCVLLCPLKILPLAALLGDENEPWEKIDPVEDAVVVVAVCPKIDPVEGDCPKTDELLKKNYTLKL